MKHLLHITLTSALLVCQLARSEELPGEVAPLTAKYEASTTAAYLARDASLSAAKALYLAALDRAELEATQAGKTEAFRSIIEEKRAVNAGSSLSATPSGNLPHLHSARSHYLREVIRIGQATAPKINQASSDYLRGLGTLETRARQTRNESLLQAFGREKLRLAGQKAATAGSATQATGKGVLGNPDFGS